MVALRRVGHRAAGQKRAAEKGQPLRVLLQNAEIQMERHRFRRTQTVGLKNPQELLLVRDGQLALSAGVRLGLLVKAEAEGLAEQLRQPFGKVRALRQNADEVRRKGVAVEQHAVGLRRRLRAARKRKPAELRLDIG